MTEEVGVIDTDKKLLKLKKELKLWEAKFLKKHKRKPLKEDIRNGPSSIKEAYREYQTLKNLTAGENEYVKETVREGREDNSGVGTLTAAVTYPPFKPSNVFAPHLNKKEAAILKSTSRNKTGINRPTRTFEWVKGRGFKKGKVPDSRLDESADKDTVTDEGETDSSVNPLLGDISEVLDRVLLKDVTQNVSSKGIRMLDNGSTVDPVSDIQKPKLSRRYRISETWLGNLALKTSASITQSAKIQNRVSDVTITGRLKGNSCFDVMEAKGNHSQPPSLSTPSTQTANVYSKRESNSRIHYTDADCLKDTTQDISYDSCPHSHSTKTGSCSNDQYPESSDDDDDNISNCSFSSMESFNNEDMYYVSPQVAGTGPHATVDTNTAAVRPLTHTSSCNEDNDYISELETCYNIDDIMLLSGSEGEERNDHEEETIARSTFGTTGIGSTSRYNHVTKKEAAVLNDVVGDEPTIESVNHTLTASSPLKHQEYLLDTVRRDEPPGNDGSGTSTGNYRRLNMKVKRYSKKPTQITGSRYKRQQWKQRQKVKNNESVQASSRGVTTCYKCGKPGHWARNCTETGGYKNLGKFDGESVSHTEDDHGMFEEGPDLQQLLDQEKLPANSVYPTIEEASQMLRSTVVCDSVSMETSSPSVDQPSYKTVDPVLELGSEGTVVKSVPSEVVSALGILGYNEFRAGQQEAVLQILSGVSTILVQPTGSGKSLCYQLPSYCYSQHFPGCITLVVSPLISLMQDQVNNLPCAIKGACIHTGMTQQQRNKVITEITSGEVNVLFVSPETLVGGANTSGWSFLSAAKLPPVAFACIDEAHCLSEWSHNFRPSYLRLSRVLRNILGIKCVLALTATASTSTVNDMSAVLGVEREHIIIGAAVPSNLVLSVSCEDNRETALVDLLRSSPFCSCDSIIVYCTRQQTTERVAQLLRTSLQYTSSGDQSEQPGDTNMRRGSGRGKRRKVDWSAECYHAGLSPAQRKRNQSDFMAGKLRIIVCTVAFGMGLDKRDVRSVIHYNMPRSFESFVQEIGRAGRDGDPAYCHVFIDKEGSDLLELRRHIYSNSMDYVSVKQLVEKTLPNICDRNNLHDETECHGHEVAIPIESLVQLLDTKEEVLLTLLCYLESHHRNSPDSEPSDDPISPSGNNGGMITLLNPINDTCCLKSYGGKKQLLGLAKRVPAVAMAMALEKEKGTINDSSTSVTFSITSVANALHCDSSIIRQVLTDICASTDSNSLGGTVMVEFRDFSFHLKTKKCFSDEDRDIVCQQLINKINHREKSDLDRLYQLYSVLEHTATNVGVAPSSTRLRDFVYSHFKDQLSPEYLVSIGINPLPLAVSQPLSDRRHAQVKGDIRGLISTHQQEDRPFTGRSIARILQGIGSPCYPAEVWGRSVFHWRKYMDIDFNILRRIATDIIINH